MAGLCERYWDDLYPPLEHDDPDFRLRPLEWVDDKLSLRLKARAVSAPTSGDSRSYNYHEWERACHVDTQVKRGKLSEDAAEAEPTRPTKESIATSWSLTNKDFFADLLAELSALLEACGRLEQQLQSKLGNDAPTMRKLRETATDIQHLLRRACPGLKEEPPMPESSPAESSPAAPEPLESGTEAARPAGTDSTAGTATTGAALSRAEAYRQLAVLADFLLETEPHSPSGYLVKRAVSWGRMSLAELLQEVVSDSQHLSSIYNLLGMPKGGRE